MFIQFIDQVITFRIWFNPSNALDRVDRTLWGGKSKDDKG